MQAWSEKARKSSIMLIAVVLFISGLVPVPGPTEVAQAAEGAIPVFDESTIFTGAESGIAGFRIPGVAVTNSGAILAFTEGRKSSLGDDSPSHIVMKRSLDNAASWGDIQVIVESETNESWSNPVPVVDRSTGKVILFYALNKHNAETQVFFMSSADDGVTWSEPAEITSLFDNDPLERGFHLPGPGHGIQLQNGRLLVVVWHRHSVALPAGQRQYGASTIYSDNGGATWEMGGYLQVDATAATDESRILELEDGTVVMNSRTVLQSRRMIATSADGGETWTRPELDATIASYGNVDSGFIRYPEAEGDLLLLSRPKSPSREKMTVDASYDGGQTWLHSKLVYGGPSAYSDMAVLNDGSILLVYEASPFGHSNPYYLLKAVRFNLAWLEHPSYFQEALYEVEDLGIAASSGREYEVQSDAAHSGGKIFLYRAAETGDYVTFNVPAAPGTYRVELQIRRGSNRAQMQLSVNGDNIGPVVDGYTSGSVDTVKFDLGSVVFAAGGDQTFTFTATGRNPADTGDPSKWLMFLDSIKLISEDRGALLAHSVIRTDSPTISYGGSTRVTVQLRDELDIPINVSAGTVALASSSGTLGEVKDNGDGTYSATLTAPAVSADNNPETITINGTLDGEPLEASAVVSLRSIERGETLVFELETAEIADSSGQDYEVQTHASSSGNALLLYRAEKVGDYVAFPINVPRPGTYRVAVRSMTNYNNRAIIALSVNGTAQGPEFDTHTESQNHVRFDLGPIAFDEAGEQLFAFTAVGRNPQNTGDPTKWLMFLDSIELQYVDHAASLEHSTVQVEPASAKSGEQATITVQLRDSAGEPLVSGGARVELQADRGLIGELTDHGDGTYSATLTMPDGPGELEIAAIVNGQPLAGKATAQVLPDDSEEEEPSPDTEPPVWPSGAFAGITDVSRGSVTLSWLAAADDNGVKEYEISWNGGSLLVDGALQTASVTGLSSGTLYTFEIVAIDEQGNRSAALTVRASTQGSPVYVGPPPTGGDTGQGNQDGQREEEPQDDDENGATEEEPGTSGGGDTPTVQLTDIGAHWAKKQIEQAVRLGIVSGFGDGSFRPDEPVRRDQLAVMFGRALKLEEIDAADTPLPFADANAIPAWARAAAQQAVRAGIVAGYEDGSFRPDRPVSRLELAVMLARALKLPVADQPAPDFADAVEVPLWGLPYAIAVYEAGLLRGREDGRFAPNDTATRAETATILVRMVEMIEAAKEAEAAK